MKERHIGSTLESLFEELGEKEDFDLLFQKKLLAARLADVMTRRGISQAALAKKMDTSRTLVRRLLNPSDTGVTFATIIRAQQAVGVPLIKIAPSRTASAAAPTKTRTAHAP